MSDEKNKETTNSNDPDATATQAVQRARLFIFKLALLASLACLLFHLDDGIERGPLSTFLSLCVFFMFLGTAGLYLEYYVGKQEIRRRAAEKKRDKSRERDDKK